MPNVRGYNRSYCVVPDLNNYIILENLIKYFISLLQLFQLSLHMDTAKLCKIVTELNKVFTNSPQYENVNIANLVLVRGGNRPIDAMLFLEFKFGYIIALCT